MRRKLIATLLLAGCFSSAWGLDASCGVSLALIAPFEHLLLDKTKIVDPYTYRRGADELASTLTKACPSLYKGTLDFLLGFALENTRHGETLEESKKLQKGTWEQEYSVAESPTELVVRVVNPRQAPLPPTISGKVIHWEERTRVPDHERDRERGLAGYGVDTITKVLEPSLIYTSLPGRKDLHPWVRWQEQDVEGKKLVVFELHIPKPVTK